LWLWFTEGNTRKRIKEKKKQGEGSGVCNSPGESVSLAAVYVVRNREQRAGVAGGIIGRVGGSKKGRSRESRRTLRKYDGKKKKRSRDCDHDFVGEGEEFKDYQLLTE